MEKLTIGAKGFSLPLELVTSTQAILARKRSGKSYTASVQAEELLEHGQQIVVFDPTGAWYGLRSSADGKEAGYLIGIFGGDHADVPLDYRSGKAMCAAVIQHGFSAVFDVSNWDTDEQMTFVMDFCREMLRINRTAIHIFMDEADTYAPQKTLDKLQARCLGTVSRLVKQGGKNGIGFTMITQRPASMNKDVLSQVDILTILRMSHPLDVKAATDWIKSEVSVEFAKEVEPALPSLPVGTAFICSASLNVGMKVEIRARRTFNSGATPKPGEKRIDPTGKAALDIAKLGKEIAESVERERENSPEMLKDRIHQLEAQIAKGGVTNMGVLEDVQQMEAELEELRPLRDRLPQLEQELETRDRRRAAFMDRLQNLISEFSEPHNFEFPPMPEGAIARRMLVAPYGDTALLPAPKHPEPDRSALTKLPESPGRIRHYAGNNGEFTVNEPQQRILDAIATLSAIRGAIVTLEWIACTAGTTPRARGFEENLRLLRKNGLVDGIQLTYLGGKLSDASSTLPTFSAVVSRLAAMLSQPQIQILTYLKSTVSATLGSIAQHCNTTERSRGFEENVRTLRKRGYVVSNQGSLSLIPWLKELR